MNGFRDIRPEELGDLTHRLREDWALLTAGYEKPNPMTVSWGGTGVLWGLDVAFCFVRPQRHTYTLMEQSDFFSLSFLDPAKYRGALQLCGAASGRDTDKFAAAGLTPAFWDRIPYAAEAETVLFCRKLYADDLKKAAFIDPTPLRYYEANDFHRMYVGAIEKIAVREH